MSKIIELEIKYNVPEQFENAGEVITGSCEWIMYDNLDEMVNALGEDKVYVLAKKADKVGTQNNARLKLMSSNGHSTREPLSEEEKAKRKTQRKADRELVRLLKEKGLTAKDIQEM